MITGLLWHNQWAEIDLTKFVLNIGAFISSTGCCLVAQGFFISFLERAISTKSVSHILWNVFGFVGIMIERNRRYD